MTSLRENREGCGRGSEVDWRLLASTAVAPLAIARCSALRADPAWRDLFAFLDTATFCYARLPPNSTKQREPFDFNILRAGRPPSDRGLAPRAERFRGAFARL